MKITDLLKKESVLLEGHVTDKKDALHTLVGLMAKQGNVADVETYEACVLKREEEGSTGVGEGVAIPHAKTSAVTRPGLAFMRCLDGVEFDSLDGQPAKLFFLIAAPDSKDNVHLDVLSRLSTLLMDPDFINGLMAVTSEDELFALITKAEAEKFADEEPAEEATPAAAGDKKAPYQVLAVTACRRALLTLIWRPKAWSSMRPKRVFPSKLRPTAKAASSMPSRLKKSKGRKASSSLLISTFP